MDESEIKHIVEAALLAAGRPLTLDRLLELFTKKGGGPDRAAIRKALDALTEDYQARGIEIKEVSSGFRIQVKRSMSDWLTPLWEERAPRYTRALLETLALVAYRQPITRAEIEEVRGVVVSTNIVRTLLERGWIRVVGHRDVPGKPAMFGTTREFLDYFGLKRLEDLPPLAEIKDNFPELSPQADLIESLDTGPHLTIVGDEDTEAAVETGPGEQMKAAAESAYTETANAASEGTPAEATNAAGEGAAAEASNAVGENEPAETRDVAGENELAEPSDAAGEGAKDETSEFDTEAESTAIELDATAENPIEQTFAETPVDAAPFVETSSIETLSEEATSHATPVESSAAAEMPVHVAAAVETAINAALAADATDDSVDDGIADDGVADEVDAGGDQASADNEPATDAEREPLRAKTAD